MLDPHYTPVEYQEYFLQQYGPEVAAAYGKVCQVHLPITRAPRRGKAPSSIQGKILEALQSGPLSCQQVTEQTGFTRSCINKHLNLLCKAGTIRRDGVPLMGYQYSLVEAGAVAPTLP